MNKFAKLYFLPLFLAFMLSACANIKPQPDASFSVVASTSIVADVVSQIAGEHVSVTSLVPSGSDPHSFEVRPQDLVRIEEADLIILNGLGLESFLDQYIENNPDSLRVATLSDSLDIIYSEEESDERHVEEGDPHVWMDPLNVKVWAQQIAHALSKTDPDNAAAYAENLASYLASLDELDAWAEQQIATIPVEERILITDHDALAYFARRYDFQIIGTVIPSISSLSEPSAADIAQLQDLINSLDAPAIFVGSEQNPDLAERLAEDTGVQVLPLYVGSLSTAEGPAASYLQLFRFDVNQIVEALR